MTIIEQAAKAAYDTTNFTKGRAWSELPAEYQAHWARAVEAAFKVLNSDDLQAMMDERVDHPENHAPSAPDIGMGFDDVDSVCPKCSAKVALPQWGCQKCGHVDEPQPNAIVGGAQ